MGLRISLSHCLDSILGWLTPHPRLLIYMYIYIYFFYNYIYIYIFNYIYIYGVPEIGAPPNPFNGMLFHYELSM